jgi:dTDP-glucose pyrophosphorylase
MKKISIEKNSPFILGDDKTIFQAIKKIQENRFKTLIVTKGGKLIGTLTDGDIRRGMLRGLDINTNISSVVNKKPIKKVIGKKQKIHKSENLETSVIPCVDKRNILKFLEIHFEDSILNNFNRNVEVVLMAGGFGKRLMPLTKNTPKPLIKINKKTLLEIIIDNFNKYGFSNFIFSTFYKSNKIKSYFIKKKINNNKIKYLVEKSPLGTAGCLSLLNYKTVKQDILVHNGDVITDLNINNLLKFHRDTQSDITVCAKESLNTSHFGQILFKGHKIKKIIEKPTEKNFINAGIYVLKKKIIKNLPKKYINMTTLIDTKIKQGANVKIYPIYEYWVDIGRKDILEKILKKN